MSEVEEESPVCSTGGVIYLSALGGSGSGLPVLRIVTLVNLLMSFRNTVQVPSSLTWSTLEV